MPSRTNNLSCLTSHLFDYCLIGNVCLKLRTMNLFKIYFVQVVAGVEHAVALVGHAVFLVLTRPG